MANSAVPKLAVVSERRPVPDGARKTSLNRAAKSSRPIPTRDDPVPAVTRVPPSERSSAWPARASSPARNSRLPPSGVPASLDKRPRSGARPLIEPRIRLRIEGDPQAAFDRAVRGRQPEPRQHQLGVPFELSRERQCPVEPVRAIGAVECCLRVGEVGDLSGEPQSVDLCPGGGKIIPLRPRS